MRKISLISFFLLLIAGCGSNDTNSGTQGGGAGNGGGNEVKTGTLNGEEYTILSGTPASAAASVSGVGALVFKKPMTSEDHNFEINFTLSEVGSSVTLVTHADASLNAGVATTFTREAADRLKVTVLVGGVTTDVSGDYTAIKANINFTLKVDVHEHGDIIVEGGGGVEGGPHVFTKGPAGRRWGLRLNKANVTQAKLARVLHPH